MIPRSNGVIGLSLALERCLAFESVGEPSGNHIGRSLGGSDLLTILLKIPGSLLGSVMVMMGLRGVGCAAEGVRRLASHPNVSRWSNGTERASKIVGKCHFDR